MTSMPVSSGISRGFVADYIPVGRRVSVRVPATSANLGPGYDSLGVALCHYDELEVTRISEGLEFDICGAGSQSVPRDSSHLVVRAMMRLWEVVGLEGLPGLHLRAKNNIPHSRGLGSSAAAIVSGVYAANALLPESLRKGAAELLTICSDMEGHPDNVAPCLDGNFALSYGELGQWYTLNVAVHEEIFPVVAIPEYEVSTASVRALIPEVVSHRDAAVNSAHTGLLTQSLHAYPEHLFAATEDLLHQQYRADAMRPSYELVCFLRERGYCAVISGAGPTVMVLGRSMSERSEVMDAIAEGLERSDIGEYGSEKLFWRVLPVDIDREGAIVTGEETVI